MIPYDVDQDGWRAQKQFADGELLGSWQVDKWVIHYGGNANFAGDQDRCLAKGYPTYPSMDAEAAVLRIYEQSHLSRGWQAIAYNYAVGQSGAVYRLRGENHSGATSGDLDQDGIPENSEARAILWIGGLGQEPTEAAYESIAMLLAADVLPVTVHSDHKSTNCPGDPLREWVAREGWKDYDMTTRFADVPEDHVFYGDIEWLAANDITSGAGTENGQPVYRPDYPVTRGQLAAFLHRYHLKLGSE